MIGKSRRPPAPLADGDRSTQRGAIRHSLPGLTFQGFGVNTTLRFFYNLSLATWLGITVFFLAVTAALFNRMPDVAGRVASLALPLYFQAGDICALFALVSVTLLALAVWKDFSTVKKVTPIVLIVLMAGLNTYGGWVVLPAAREARIELHENQKAGTARTSEQKAALEKTRNRFQRLHRLSTQLFGVVFFLIGATIIFSSFVLRI